MNISKKISNAISDASKADKLKIGKDNGDKMNYEEKLNLDYFNVRKATNGWMITRDGPERGYLVNEFWVFRTLEEMFAWIREQTDKQ